MGLSRSHDRSKERLAVPVHSYFQEPRRVSRRHTGAQPLTTHRPANHPHQRLEEIEGCRAHYEQKERCIYCDILRQDLSDGDRIVAENPEFSASPRLPPAFPLKCGFSPNGTPATSKRARRHNSSSSRRFSPKRYDGWTRSSLGLPYNFVLHSSPLHEKTGDFYHWHIEIIPKLTQVAGFEWGTGFYINPVAPEESAKFLREADI